MSYCVIILSSVYRLSVTRVYCEKKAVPNFLHVNSDNEIRQDSGTVFTKYRPIGTYRIWNS